MVRYPTALGLPVARIAAAAFPSTWVKDLVAASERPGILAAGGLPLVILSVAPWNSKSPVVRPLIPCAMHVILASFLPKTISGKPVDHVHLHLTGRPHPTPQFGHPVTATWQPMRESLYPFRIAGTRARPGHRTSSGGEPFTMMTWARVHRSFSTPRRPGPGYSGSDVVISTRLNPSVGVLPAAIFFWPEREIS
jgi:hypothetical protein